MKILLVDDDEDDRVLFCEAVAMICPDLKCEVVTNGEECIHYLSCVADLPDIIFLDINMPIMDGRETLSIIRSTPRLKGAYVVTYSTSNATQDARWFNLKSDSYLTKPNHFDILVKLLSLELAKCLMAERNQKMIRQAC